MNVVGNIHDSVHSRRVKRSCALWSGPFFCLVGLLCGLSLCPSPTRPSQISQCSIDSRELGNPFHYCLGSFSYHVIHSPLPIHYTVAKGWPSLLFLRSVTSWPRSNIFIPYGNITHFDFLGSLVFDSVSHCSIWFLGRSSCDNEDSRQSEETLWSIARPSASSILRSRFF